MKKFFLCFLSLILVISYCQAQKKKYKQSVTRFGISLDPRYNFVNNTILNKEGQKVAFQNTSFLMQFSPYINVYNLTKPIDFGFNFPVRKNIANNYINLATKDSITINRYYQFSPGTYLKLKLGDYKTKYRYWFLYGEANYNINFLFKRKDMKFRYQSFDPVYGEWNILNGLANQFNRTWSSKNNRTDDTYIDKNGGFSYSVGIGREWMYDGEGFGWAITFTRNLFDTYNNDYQTNSAKPFKEWDQKNWFVEFKFIKRFKDIFHFDTL